MAAIYLRAYGLRHHGPRDQRTPKRNSFWGRIESNDVGIDEFMSFCEAVGAEAIICLLRDDSFREKAGAAAHDLFRREYTIDRHCDALKEHYLRLLAGASP